MTNPLSTVSPQQFLDIAAQRIVPADVILDVGCGIRPQPYITPKVHLCADAHPPYLTELQRQLATRPHDRQYVLLNADWDRATQLFPAASVDTVFLLDIIEHLEKADSLRLLEKTTRIARKQIVVFTTLGFIPQSHPDGRDAWGLDGGSWQEHRSGWTPDDFPGWDVVICPNFHQADNLGRPYAEPKGALWAFFDARTCPKTAPHAATGAAVLEHQLPRPSQEPLPEAFLAAPDWSGSDWQATLTEFLEFDDHARYALIMLVDPGCPGHPTVSEASDRVTRFTAHANEPLSIMVIPRQDLPRVARGYSRIRQVPQRSSPPVVNGRRGS